MHSLTQKSFCTQNSHPFSLSRAFNLNKITLDLIFTKNSRAQIALKIESFFLLKKNLLN